MNHTDLINQIYNKYLSKISDAKSFLADIRGTRWARHTGGGKGKNNFSSLFE